MTHSASVRPGSPPSLLLLLVALGACSGAADDGAREETGGTGPTNSTGAAGAGFAGSAVTGATGGALTTGGTGGASATGGAGTGGALTTGGTGGATATGGAETGGALTTGGTGSATATGGAGTGGALTTGGTGGATATGGAGTGGADTGGTAGTAGAAGAAQCPTSFPNEAFRDDFEGTALDLTRWSIVQQNSGGGGEFTQLTKMLAANVSVAAGRLHVSSRRHCEDPYPTLTAEHPTQCAGTNFYSGAWLRTSAGYAGGRGLMIFLAKMPAPVPGMFPALWARNTESGVYYGELDLIETWWDAAGKGVASDPNRFAVTTWVGTGAQYHTSGNLMPAVANLPSVFHVWEVEWDATAVPPAVSYYYRDQPGAERRFLRTVTASTAGLSGHITDQDFATILSAPFRPYVDFAVQPETTWHVGPDAAAVYDPEDLEVESVVVCAP